MDSSFRVCNLNMVRSALRIITTAVILIVSMLAATVGSSSCAKETKDFASMMGTVPYGSSHFSYWAIGTLDTDEDLWEIYDRFKQSPDAQQLRQFVPVLATIKQSAKVVSYDNTSLMSPATVFCGEFDVNGTKAIIETLDYTKTSYRDVGIWTTLDNQTIFDSVAIKSGSILMGEASDLKCCIDVMAKGSTRSLYDDPNIRLVVGRLPDGAIVEVARIDSCYYGERYADLVTYGKSYTKAGKDTLKLTAVYLFGDEPAASAAQQPVKDSLSATFENVKAKRDGNLIIATSEVSISKFAQMLVF